MDHLALASALDENKTKKTFQSRLLPYHFEIVHIPMKDMRIVDNFWRDPYKVPWPKSESDKRFVVVTTNAFLRALDCMMGRPENNFSLNRNEIVVEYFRNKVANKSSPRVCYGNQNGQKRTQVIPIEKKNHFSRPSKQLNSSSQLNTNYFTQFQPINSRSAKLKKQFKSQQNKNKKNRLIKGNSRKKLYRSIVRMMVRLTSKMEK